MGVRFVIGRAGSGKTHHCLQVVHSQLADAPADGGRLILLVPEQASLQTERALLSHPEVGASFRAEVLSFRRLAYRALQAAGGDARRVLSAHGRVMALRYLIARLQPELRLYGNIDRMPGLVSMLSRAITELIDEAVEPGDLAGVDAPEDEPLLRHKLHDLGLLYAAYLEHLGPDKVDPSQQLEAARQRLDACDWLADCRIWVDGFAGFTGQQRLMLVELARRAASIEITMMIDPAYAIEAGDQAPVDPVALFGKIQRTYLEMRRAFVEGGVPVDEPLLLTDAPPPRFVGEPVLAGLEASFGVHGVNGEPRPEAGEDKRFGPANAPVTVVQASDRRAEVEYAASLVCHLVQKEGRRFRDIAIVLRDLEPYHDLLSAALLERDVPFFIDRRRPTSHHPVVELLRGLVGIVLHPLGLEPVCLLLKTGLTGLADVDADDLENYLLACGVEGAGAWRTAEDWSLPSAHSLRGSEEEPSACEQLRMDGVNLSRRQLWTRLSLWYEAAGAGPRTGAEWVALLIEALEAFRVGEQLTRWSVRAEEDGDLDLAEQHRQIVRDVSAFLDDLCVSLGGERMGIERFREVLESGLAELTLGLAPPMLDQLLVGSIERSRHPDIRVAIIMGFNEGVFPHSGGEDAVLNDDDRDWLAARGIRVGITRRQRTLDEPLLAYTALTRASERVYLTYATADEDGRPLAPSLYLDALERACPMVRHVTVDDGFRSRSMWNVRTSRDLAKRLAFEMRNRPALSVDDSALRSRWNDLYEAARGGEGLRERLSAAMASLTYVNDARLMGGSVSRMVKVPLRVSVSRLETFATCAFKHFSQYGLRLEERASAKLAHVDVGTIHHAILEYVVRAVVENRRSLGDLPDEDLRDLLEAGSQAVASAVATDPTRMSARDRYVLMRSAAELDRVLSAQRRTARAGRFRPGGAEVGFGCGEAGDLPALRMVTPKGREVLLRGFIDRVDLAELADEALGVVVDYKRTRNKSLDLSRVYHGISLQLLGYLLVLAEHGQTLAGRPVEPVGAFYLSLVDGYESVAHPSDVEDGSAGTRRKLMPRGLLNAERFDAFDAEYDGRGRSEYYNLSRGKKDGALNYVDATDAADGDTFSALLDHTRAKMGELADGIIDGDVSVNPYRVKGFSPCSWCPFGAVCRFEFGVSLPRYLDRLSRSEVFARVRREAPSGE